MRFLCLGPDVVSGFAAIRRHCHHDAQKSTQARVFYSCLRFSVVFLTRARRAEPRSQDVLALSLHATHLLRHCNSTLVTSDDGPSTEWPA